jgi:hypothetical protein
VSDDLGCGVSNLDGISKLGQITRGAIQIQIIHTIEKRKNKAL